MSYRPTKGRRLIDVSVRDWGNQPWSLAARLAPHVGRSFSGMIETAETLHQMSEAECDFYVRRGLLNETCLALNKIARRRFVSYERGTQVPKGYSSAGSIVDKKATELAVKAEALISCYLDGLYIVQDRLTKATRAMNKESRNKLWRDISVPRATSRPGQSSVWPNIIEDFQNHGATEALHAANYRRAISDLRRQRTHSLHLEVFLEHVPGDRDPTVFFASQNPWESASPKVRFSDRDRIDFTGGMLALVSWWHDQTLAML